MKLADALRGMSSRSLAVYRQASGAPQAETAELVARLTAPARVRGAVADLSPAAHLALRILWFQPGPVVTPWAFRAIYERLSPGGGGERAVDELVGQALALPPLAAGGQYAIPDEVRPILGDTVHDVWLNESGAFGPGAGPSAAAAPARPPEVVNDFARLLGAIGAAGLRLRRQDGAPYQADQQRVCAAMDRSSLPAMPPSGASALAWDGYEPSLAPLIASGAALGLLGVHEGAWRALERCDAWTALPPATQWRGLLQAWMSLWSEQAPPLVHGCRTVLAALRRGCWCRPAVLTAWIGSHMPDTVPPLPDAVHHLLVRTGVRLGALEWGWSGIEGERGGLPECTVRLCPPAVAALEGTDPDAWPAPEAPLVQGTFQVVAGPGVRPAGFRLLELWAERESLDRFATYRLTQRSVRGAAARGLQPHALLAALADSPGGVPQNVAFSVAEWARPSSRLVAEIGVVVRPARAAPPSAKIPGNGATEAAPAEEDAELAGVLTHGVRLGPAAWLIPPDALPEMWEALERAGFQVSGDLGELMARLRRRPDPADAARSAPIPLPWPGVPGQIPWPESP